MTMATKTAAGLVSFAKTKIGVPYVYGAKGQTLTFALFNALRERYGSMVWASDKNKIGKVCVDCSGLISWYTGKVINSTAFKNTATKVLTIDKISQAVPGCAVWRSGHIGIYIGDGYIIEARGSAYGVVKTKVSERNFTHILWLKDIDYSAAKTTTATTSTAASGKYTIKLHKGRYNVRKSASTKSEILRVINGDTTHTATKLSSGWYYVPTLKGWLGPACIKSAVVQKAKKTVEQIAKEVIAGKWGNGSERKKKIEAAGYNYSEVQKAVNKLL